MKTVAIIGFGRFGPVLYRLLENDFNVILYDQHPNVFTGKKFSKNTYIAQNEKEIYRAETIFYAVPILTFESVIKSHKKYFNGSHLLIDVLSVKLHPQKIFNKYLKNSGDQALLTHPIFGPDSSKQGFSGLSIVLDRFRTAQNNFNFWKNFFVKKELKVIELSAKEHDKLAANSQGVVHFVGRLLEQFNFKQTRIDTLGAEKLQEVMEQTCNDTWELFLNLQNYNPYTKMMRIKLGQAYDRLYNKLLPKMVNPCYLIYGIQGGAGSFNEEAILSYTKEKRIKNFRIKYLYTSEKVLNHLHRGDIDYGLFAVHNAVGGLVWESVRAMTKYKFKIIEEFPILIRHFLMKRKNVRAERINRIMAHPQAFAQCKKTLAKKYPSLILESGKGDLIDTAKAAWALAKGKLPNNYAILGPAILSKFYNLEIINEDLQDNKNNNYTSFFLVGR